MRALVLAWCCARAAVGAVTTDLTGVHLDITTVYDGAGAYVDMFDGGSPSDGFAPKDTWTGFIVDHARLDILGSLPWAHTQSR